MPRNKRPLSGEHDGDNNSKRRKIARNKESPGDENKENDAYGSDGDDTSSKNPSPSEEELELASLPVGSLLYESFSSDNNKSENTEASDLDVEEVSEEDSLDDEKVVNIAKTLSNTSIGDNEAKGPNTGLELTGTTPTNPPKNETKDNHLG